MSDNNSDQLNELFDNENYTFNDPVLTVHNSDCYNIPHRPPALTSVSSKGAVRTRVDPGTLHWQRSVDAKEKWLIKLGTSMVQDFLFVNLGSVIMKHKKYRLQEFPEGYSFYTIQRGTGAFDHYLYGGRRQFASPAEFKFHLAWLIDGSEPDMCKCQYCSEERSQRALNRQEREITREAAARVREAMARGEEIIREPNVLNRRAFLRQTAPSNAHPDPAAAHNNSQDQNSE